MPKNLITFLLFLCFITSFSQTNGPNRMIVVGQIKDENMRPVSYAHIFEKSSNEGWVGDYYGIFRAEVYPGDTLVISAVSYHHALVNIPFDFIDREYHVEVIMQQDTVQLKELVIYPWPATYSQLKKDFLKVEVEDPLADLDLHLPSPEELKMLSYSLEGGFGLKVPVISLLYNKYSKEARFKRDYAEAMKMEKVYSRYNITLVSRITGLKNEDDIQKFMQFCALQIKFILESTDYELYAAVLNCYDEYCKAGFQPDQSGE